MVKIAIAGASGNVAQELLEVLTSSQKHEIVLLSRKAILGKDDRGLTAVQVDYHNPNVLEDALQSVHTLLCFITPQSDPGNIAQKNLINAAIKAGVKRYAPSEWASSSFEYMPWYAGKQEIRTYLANINQDRKVLEYCLFQPGMFVDYFVSPHRTTKHIHPFQNHIDFNNRRAIVVDSADDARLSLISAREFCQFVVRAIEYEGEWPVVGGIRGDDVSVGQLIAIGESIRGPFTIEKVQAEDLKAGIVKTTWLPKVDHPAIPIEQVSEVAEGMVAGMLLGTSVGAMSVSDEWNRLLPDLEFTRAEEFLKDAWKGKN